MEVKSRRGGGGGRKPTVVDCREEILDGAIPGGEGFWAVWDSGGNSVECGNPGGESQGNPRGIIGGIPGES